ncbi:hypothetical protein EK21DRAFT_89388 [Setomelanomma holmii]|uniref:Uncharacterized protein n=1 Tax=Setomelanomma holmii TaxID=210430 RepID=A0A9P4HBA3_9PLEO|nr:hypothetical protein EK21DRAFT_89388 [Setomelanomma holmii]
MSNKDRVQPRRPPNTGQSAAIRGLYPSNTMPPSSAPRNARLAVVKCPAHRALCAPPTQALPHKPNMDRRHAAQEPQDARHDTPNNEIAAFEDLVCIAKVKSLAALKDSSLDGVLPAHLDLIAEREAADLARQREEDDTIRRTVANSERDATDPTEAQLYKALFLSQEEALLLEHERDVEMRAIRDVIPRSKIVAAREAEARESTERLKKKYRVQHLSEEEEAQLAMVASEDQTRPARMNSTPPPRPPPKDDDCTFGRVAQFRCEESLTQPNLRASTLPAPVARRVGNPEWLVNTPILHSPSTNSMHEAERCGQSAAVSQANVSVSAAGITPHPIAPAAHVLRTSSSIPRPHIGGYPNAPGLFKQGTAGAAATPDMVAQNCQAESRGSSSTAFSASSFYTTLSRQLIGSSSSAAACSDMQAEPLIQEQDSSELVYVSPELSQKYRVEATLPSRAVTQRYRLAKEKANEAAFAQPRTRGRARSLLMSRMQSSISALNLGLGRRASDSNWFQLDMEDDEHVRVASPSPSLVSKLEHAAKRLQSSSSESLHRSRSNQVSGVGYVRDSEPTVHGSPTSLQPARLQLVTERSPSPPSPPSLRPPVPTTTDDVLERAKQDDAAFGLGTSVGGDFKDSALGMSNVSLRSLYETPTPAPRNRGYFRLSPRASNSLFETPPNPINRRPVSVASFAGTTTVVEGPQQYPILAPAADERRTETPDSLYAWPDSPGYTKATLARKHVHPSVNMEWANVPPAGQKLEYYNSRAIMDVERFGHGVRTLMPTIPEQADFEAEPDAEARLTPNTKAKKAEKDLQRRLRRAT